MTWAQHLKRVFNIDVDTCEHSGGPVSDHRHGGSPAADLPDAPVLARRLVRKVDYTSNT